MKLSKHHFIWGFFGLATVLIIFMLVTNFAYTQRQADDLAGKMDRISFDLLGFVEYKQGQFLVEPDQHSNYQQFLQSRLASLAMEQPAYIFIWDRQRQQMAFDIEDVLQSPANSIDHAAIKKELADLVSSAGSAANNSFMPINMSKRVTLANNDEFLVVTQVFRYNDGDDRSEYAYISAIALQKIKADAWAILQTNAFILIILLFLVTGGCWLIMRISNNRAEPAQKAVLESAIRS